MITDKQFADAAKIIGCDIAAIKSVYEVEAAGHGYLDDGRVKILFEGHRFWKALAKTGKNPAKFIVNNPTYSNVLYPNWDKRQYKGGAKEWDRVSQAIEVCKSLNVSTNLALDSASYGSFQIMGENHSLCGYPDSQTMLTSYNNGGEAEQLNSFCRFVLKNRIDDELRNHDWAGFAKVYNGTGYRENAYDTKLAAAYKKYNK